MALVGSFWLRRWLWQRTWRLVHWRSFLAYVLALLHGIGAETDTASPLVAAGYWLSSAAVLFLALGRGLALAIRPVGR